MLAIENAKVVAALQYPVGREIHVITATIESATPDHMLAGSCFSA